MTAGRTNSARSGDAASPAPGVPWYRHDSHIACPARRTDLHLRQLDDQAVLYDPTNGMTYRLNLTAYLIWQMCDPSRTIGELARHLADQFQVDPAVAQDDVEQLLAMFASNGMLQTAANPAENPSP